jgi:hypothetical protein
MVDHAQSGREPTGARRSATRSQGEAENVPYDVPEDSPEADVDVDEFELIDSEDAATVAEAAAAYEANTGGSATNEAEGHGDVCPVVFCPIGMALSTASQVRPEAVEHLIAAGRELMLAARSALDVGAGDRGASSLQRIRID